MNKAYLAGLIDGEGYLGIIPIRKANSKNLTYQCAIKLSLAGLHAEEVTGLIADNYQGHVYKRNSLTGTGKTVYTVEVKSRQRVKKLIDDIYKYLIVKSEQADLMREYVSMPMLHPNHSSFSQELFNRRAELVRELKNYTQRIPLAETE